MAFRETALKTGLTALLLWTLSAVALGGTIADEDNETFEDGSHPFFLVTLDGQPPAASLSITGDLQNVHDGKFSLEYAYERLSDPMPILVHPTLLTDLTKLRYWIKSEKQALWMTYHVDRDGAQFNAFTLLPAGQWVLIDLAPGDFTIDPNSPVQKPDMEPERNGFHWFGLDIAQLTGPAGPNTIWIDSVSVERPPIELVPGPVVLQNGASMTITDPTLIDGGLVVIGGASFDSDATRLVINGDIAVYGSNSQVKIREGTLRANSRFRYERQYMAVKRALLRFENLLLALGANAGLTATERGACEIWSCSFTQGIFTAGTMDTGRIDIRDTSAPGEFIVHDRSEFTAENVDMLLVWFVADEGLHATLTLPPNQISSWSLDPAWNRRLILQDIDHAEFGLIVGEGCELLAQGGTFLAVGVTFYTTDAVLAGYNNGDYVAGHTFNWPGRLVRFEDVTVKAWNFYASNDSKLTIRDSLFGEALTFNSGSITIFDSVCDGSGGYLGARDTSQVRLIRSDALCEVVCDGDSGLGMKDGTVTGPVTAADNAIIVLSGCTILGDLIELDNGRILVW